MGSNSSAALALLLTFQLACADTGEAGSDTGTGAVDSSSTADTTGGAASASTSSSGGGGASNTSGSASGGAGASDIGPAFCPDLEPPTESGFEVGDQLSNLVVKDCDGNDVSLDAFCGAEGLWIFAAHGWCPLCQSVSGKQETIVGDYDGLIAINVLLEDGLGETPDTAYCENWRASHGHAEVFTLFDPTGSILALWPGGSTSLSAFVDRRRIIHSKLTHESDEATIRAEIEATLAP